MEYRDRISLSYKQYDGPEFKGGLTLKCFRNFVRVAEVILPTYTKKMMGDLIFKPRVKKNDPKDKFLKTADVTDTFTLRPGVDCKYYIWGGKQPDVILVHGWESKSSHFSTLIKLLVEKNHCVLAFDSVAHGQSEGKQSDLLDFVGCIQQLHQKFNSIGSIIGYSFGGLAAVNAVKSGLPVQRIGIISAPSSFYGIFEKLSAQLNLSEAMKRHLSEVVLNRYGICDSSWDTYSGYANIEHISIPLVAIHDNHDTYVKKIESEVLVDAWPEASLIETNNLGHRGIIRSAESLAVFYHKLYA